MKIFKLFILLFALNVNAQEEKVPRPQEDEEEEIDVPFTIIESVPEFPDCVDDLDKRQCFQTKMQEHVIKHFKYPREAQKNNIQGKVFITFVIEKDGSTTIGNIRAPHPILENEARRIMGKLPILKPATQKGKAVRMIMTMPILFKLS